MTLLRRVIAPGTRDTPHALRRADWASWLAGVRAAALRGGAGGLLLEQLTHHAHALRNASAPVRIALVGTWPAASRVAEALRGVDARVSWLEPVAPLADLLRAELLEARSLGGQVVCADPGRILGSVERASDDVGNAGALGRSAAFDLVASAFTLAARAESDAAATLALLARGSARRWLAVEFTRGLPAALRIEAATRLAGAPPMVLAEVSRLVRGGFAEGELEAIARAAGLRRARVRDRRSVLVVEGVGEAP